MRILVCAKQVRDTQAHVSIDQSGERVIVDPSAPSRMNKYDEHALEAALSVKDSLPETVVDVVCVGPSEWAPLIKRALGMGADNGIHIIADDDEYVSPWATASRIASFAMDRGYDLILTGVMSEDMMNCLTGPTVAELLALPYATSCVLVRLDVSRQVVYVEREIEGGLRDCLELRLPALLTVQSGINKPRYPTLSNMMRASRQTLETIDSASIPGPEHTEVLVGLGYPGKIGSGIVLEGSRQEKAVKLLQILREKSLLV